MEAQTTTQVESSQPILLDQKLEQSLDAVISATTVNDKKERDSARGEIDLLIAKVMSGQIKLEGQIGRAHV